MGVINHIVMLTAKVDSRIETVGIALLSSSIYATWSAYYGSNRKMELTVKILETGTEVLLEDISGELWT